MKTLEEFKAYYVDGLAPELEAFEARRKGVLLKLAALVLASLSMMAFSAYVQFFGEGLFEEWWTHLALGLLPFVAGVVLLIFGTRLLIRSYVGEYKSGVMDRVAKFIDGGLSFSRERFVPESAFVESQIFEKRPDRYTGEDCVWGAIGKTSIEFSEVHAQERVVSEDGRGNRQESWETIFKGIFFVADFNKEFKGRTLVLPDTAERLFGGIIGSFMQKHTIGRPDLVKLENPDFERLFVVYGNDQVEARYILSPSLMERLVNFKKKTDKRVFFSFVKSRMMMAIPYDRDLFEPRLFRTALSFKDVEDHFENLGLVAGVVEDLSLNTRIWGKE